MRASLLAGVGLLCNACAGSPAVPPGRKVYAGQFSAVVVESTVTTSLQGGGTFPCTNTYTMSGTITMTIDPSPSGSTGNAKLDGNQIETAHSKADSCTAKGNLAIN